MMMTKYQTKQVAILSKKCHCFYYRYGLLTILIIVILLSSNIYYISLIRTCSSETERMLLYAVKETRQLVYSKIEQIDLHHSFS